MHYNIINVLPFNGHGWCSENHQKMMKMLINTHSVKTIIEIGCWMGKSGRFMASQLPDDGKIFCVDIWDDPNNTQMYQQFLSNAIHENLHHKIIPIRMGSLQAESIFKITADMIYIDGDHDEEPCYQDIKRWSTHLNEGGVMCGDDYSWRAYPGVVIAVNRYAQENNLRVNNLDRFWWYSSN